MWEMREKSPISGPQADEALAGPVFAKAALGDSLRPVPGLL